MRRFMEVLYRKKTAYDEREVLANLPPAMAKQLLDCMYRQQVLLHLPSRLKNASRLQWSHNSGSFAQRGRHAVADYQGTTIPWPF